MADAVAIVAACHCGQARITLPRLPEVVLECNCSLCSKLGWRGVYGTSAELVIEGDFDGYVRSDVSEPMIRILRCARCGTTTHWEPLSAPPHERMGVNARLIDPEVLADVPVQTNDGRSWGR
jgi:hypothetical protein